MPTSQYTDKVKMLRLILLGSFKKKGEVDHRRVTIATYRCPSAFDPTNCRFRPR